jgi:hypothetical protein
MSAVDKRLEGIEILGEYAILYLNSFDIYWRMAI